MQRTAQGWIVLTKLTQHDATALGLVVVFQFAPQIALLPWAGSLADKFDRRRVLILTQSGMAILTGALGLLTLMGQLQLWELYAFASTLGAVSAFDAPARQTFVSELVGDQNIGSAFALNSILNSVARVLGPALAGILVGVFGAGLVFIFNGLTFLAVVAATIVSNPQLGGGKRSSDIEPNQLSTWRYMLARPRLIVILTMLGIVGSFGLNFGIFVPTMSLLEFHLNATGYGWMSVTGAHSCAAMRLQA